MIGQRIGRLIVFAAAPARGGKTMRPTWHCRCDCGADAVVLQQQLRSGRTQSCGCLRIDRVRDALLKHGSAAGYKRTPEYRTWIAMLARCSNEKRREYAQYGGRGIRVCDRWRDSFAAFLADMGERPAGKTIDRINNDGHYEPGNCRWASTAEQLKNRKSRKHQWRGQSGEFLKATAREAGINYGTLYDRVVHQGLSVETAIAKPKRC